MAKAKKTEAEKLAALTGTEGGTPTLETPTATGTGASRWEIADKYPLILGIVKNIGAEVDNGAVFNVLEQQGYTGFSEATVKQYVLKARKELGYAVREKNNTGTPTTRSPRKAQALNSLTMADLFATLEKAEALTTKHKMKPSELLAFLTELAEFGELETLNECLTHLAKTKG